jgi:hypothetical protein
VTRHYAAASGSPTFETWTTIAPLAGAATIADLNAFKLTVVPGSIHLINGLQGDNSDNQVESAFSLQQRELDLDEEVVLGAAGRSSEQTVAWIAIDSGPDMFFAGLMWMDHESEPLQEASDVPLSFLSRSVSVLGLCFRTGQFREDDHQQMVSEIEIYKMTRDALGTAARRGTCCRSRRPTAGRLCSQRSNGTRPKAS